MSEQTPLRRAARLCAAAAAALLLCLAAAWLCPAKIGRASCRERV